MPLPFAGQVDLNISINVAALGWSELLSAVCCCHFLTWSMNLWAIMPLITKKASLSAFSWCATPVSAGLVDGREGWARWIVIAGCIFLCSVGQMWEYVVCACLFSGTQQQSLPCFRNGLWSCYVLQYWCLSKKAARENWSKHSKDKTQAQSFRVYWPHYLVSSTLN